MITVLDVNDNAPHFESSKIRYYVREDKDPGTIIAKIEADDRDIEDKANVEYFLLPNRETNNMFYLEVARIKEELSLPHSPYLRTMLVLRWRASRRSSHSR